MIVINPRFLPGDVVEIPAETVVVGPFKERARQEKVVEVIVHWWAEGATITYRMSDGRLYGESPLKLVFRHTPAEILG